MSKVVLITGPPLNGRDKYINAALDIANDIKIGYHHVFTEMQKISGKYGITNLTRENVLEVNRLSNIRKDAFDNIVDTIKQSNNDIDIVSTPAKFYINPTPQYPSGRVNGIEEYHLQILSPDLVVLFISDLLKVKQNLVSDDLWKSRSDASLYNLAKWRGDSIEVVKNFKAKKLQREEQILDTIIFANSHDYSTFINLIKGCIPRIYLSFHITDAPNDSLLSVEKVKQKLQNHFVCIDPYKIKDWDIIQKYDNALENGKNDINFDDFNEVLSIQEVEKAINDIRAQTVERDYQLIESCYATTVLHFSRNPSYGVMSEIIYSNINADNPVYVLYPFKKRPSPFFEFYINDPSRIIQGENDPDTLVIDLINKMNNDINRGKWTRWPV